MKRVAVAVVERETQPAAERGLDVLRGALASAGAAAREEVLVEFLEDDLHEARAALTELGAYVEDIASAVRDGHAGRRDLLALARGRRPDERVDALHVALAGMRSRLARIASRLPG